MSNSFIVQGIIVLTSILLYRLFFRRETKVLPLPPGPKPLPLVGNVRDGPPAGKPEFFHWLTFKDKYGPISSVTMLGQTIVILHDSDAAAELLEKKQSLKASGRPTFTFSELCGYSRWLSFLQPDDQFRLQRKLIHQHIGTKTLASEHTKIQDVETKRYLLRVLKEPDNLFNHFRSVTAAAILKLAYGYSIELNKPDALVKVIEGVMEFGSKEFIPFKWAVDLIPALAYLPEWFPGTRVKRVAREAKAVVDVSIDVPFDFVKQQMAAGTYEESYCSNLINTFNNSGNKMGEDIEYAIKWSAGIMFAGASDTTVSSLMGFALAMIMNPDVQRKAQEEIDRVVGPDRLPTTDDQENLPYVDAVIKEILRYHPVLPLGVPHKATEEILFRGYRIPRGSVILPAIWWFLHDPNTYPEPSKFTPERFLEPRNEPDPDVSFGYGRRVCPGRFVAVESLYLTISRTLAAFNISKAMQGGGPVEVEHKHTAGLVDHPAEYQYSIVPRSEKYAELIRRVEIDHPWEGSAEFLPQNSILDKFKEK